MPFTMSCTNLASRSCLADVTSAVAAMPLRRFMPNVALSIARSTLTMFPRLLSCGMVRFNPSSPPASPA